MATVLAIETSCDETSVALVKDGRQVLSNIVSTQIDMHKVFGGVVPEVASREHLKMLLPVLDQALVEAKVKIKDIDVVAATNGPGLVGALLVGVSSAKALSLVWNKPYVGVNHVEGHMFATFLENPKLKAPVIVLLVAGGHTQIVHLKELGEYEILGSTIDDAAGEAFDKVARYLGLGYPGGLVIDKLAKQGNPEAIKFPRAMQDKSYDFSFSGLKTSVINYVRKHPEAENADLAASFQEAVVDVLVKKTIKAAASKQKQHDIQGICLGGGVSANTRLREKISQEAKKIGLEAYLPSLAYCTDNAAMIAAAANWRYENFGEDELDTGANPSLSLI